MRQSSGSCFDRNVLSRPRLASCILFAKGPLPTGRVRPLFVYRLCGEVAERSKAPHSKCGVGVSSPWVRIPPSPPITIDRIDIFSNRQRCSHNRSPIDGALGEWHYYAAGMRLQIRQAKSGEFTGLSGSSFIHTFRDKSRSQSQQFPAFPSMAASPLKMMANEQLTKSAGNQYIYQVCSDVGTSPLV